MPSTDRRTQLYLSAQQHAAVQRIARERRLSMAGVVREALALYLTDAQARQAPGGDPLADLIGVFEGPGDLSERHDDHLDPGASAVRKRPAKPRQRAR